MKWKCHTCGKEFVARASNKRSAKDNMLIASRNHYKRFHPHTIGRRISKGLKNRDHNPSVQDLIEALSTGPREAIEVYKRYNERQYQQLKRIMDPLEPVLPDNIVIAWKVLEALHDSEYYPKPRQG